MADRIVATFAFVFWGMPFELLACAALEVNGRYYGGGHGGEEAFGGCEGKLGGMCVVEFEVPLVSIKLYVGSPGCVTGVV